MNPILSITQLNTYVKGLLDSDANLSRLFVRGEISNFTNHYKSGHFYLTLKDDKCAVKSVMFRSSAQRLVFTPENGMTVICSGRVSLFERDGSYQFYIDDMQPDGVGSLQVAYEQLKQKLAQAGLFDQAYKKPIPRFPQCIAVITSPTGAAVQDITNILSRRYPVAEMVMCPALVQGELAAGSLIDAVEYVNELDCADVIIIGRGGGSIEDLWAFNDEKLAYAIFNSHIPVISAVGHETDFTICDFVSDLRAPTPSAAAELAVPDMSEISAYLSITSGRLKEYCKSDIDRCESKLRSISERRVFTSPDTLTEPLYETLDRLDHRLNLSAKSVIDSHYSDMSILAGKLDALSPMKTLSRGFTVTRDSAGNVVRKAGSLKCNDVISVMFDDGQCECTVNDIKIGGME